MPASPLSPLRHASANLTAAYACIPFVFIHLCLNCEFYWKSFRIHEEVTHINNQNRGLKEGLSLTIDSVADPAPAFACKDVKLQIQAPFKCVKMLA